MRLIHIVCAALLLLASPLTLAADAEGRFAVKSAGGTKCSQFIEAIKSKDQNRIALYVGWLAGYLSAANQLNTDTFDLAAWQDMRTLTALLTRHCDRNADVRFGAATAQMINALKQNRLKVRSEAVVVEHDGQSLQIYEAALKLAQGALTDLGMYAGALDGKFTDATRESLVKFQTENNLPTTGLPDQTTLFALFRAQHNAKAQ